jgi:flagellar biosynthetic protein FliP
MNKKIFFMAMLLILAGAGIAVAQDVGGLRMPIPKIAFDIREAAGPRETALSLQILFLLTILTLAPAIIMMMTAFTRVVIVLDFIKRALSLQQMPPNQIIVGFSIFLTFFIMAPTFTKVNEEALQPYLKGKIDSEVFFNKGMEPMRGFMFRQTREKDIALFIKLAKIPKPKNQKEVPSYCLIPAFMISELKRAFQMGFLIYLPFLVIDLVVSTVLMALGMMMLPPMMVSLPLKLLFFVLADGWTVMIRSLVQSFL